MQDREQLIASIYEAAVVPELWPEVLDEVARLSGGIGGILFTARPAQILKWTSSGNIAEQMAEFVGNPEYQANNIRLQHGIAARHHGFFGNHELYGPETMERSVVYREFFRKHGLGYAAGSVLPIPNGDVAIIDIERRFVDGPMTASDLALLDGLRPHLARASVIATRLGLERARAVVEALGAIGMPAAVLSVSQRLLSANENLERLSPQVRFLARDRLGLSDVAAQTLLDEALVTGPMARASRSVAVPALDGKPAAVLHLLPLPGQARDLFSGAWTLLVMTQLDRPAAPTVDLLGGLFDLTAAEARIARGIAEGGTTEAVASRLGLTVGTVRSTLKSVFMKTGVGRQSDLVALLSGLALPRDRA